MFLSSYTPLFLILLLKSLSGTLDEVPIFVNMTIPEYVVSNITFYDRLQIINQYKSEFFYYSPISITVIVATVVIIILSNLILLAIVIETKRTTNPKDLYITSVQKLDNVYINYLLCYIIPFISFNYSNIFDMLSLLILLSIACVICINSDLLYVNVFFSIRGYNIFKVTNQNKDEYVVLSKKKQLYLREIIEVRDVSASSERFVLDTE
jgi:hypothetical protein